MITNSLFAIGIPSYNRADILNPNLIRYTSQLFPNTQIIIVDNGQQTYYEHENILVLKQHTNQFVSKSWNILCDTIFAKYPYGFIINDDIGLNQIEDDIMKLIIENPGVDLYNSFFDFCSFIIPKETYQVMGRFDEKMSCWFSDNDMLYRLKKRHGKILMTSALNPTEFRRASTIEKDPILNTRFELDRQAYIKKWGGGVGSEQN